MRGYRTLGVAAVLLALLAGTAVAQQALTWTAGALGGGWFDISTGMGALLREKANLTIRVIPGGGAQNPVLVDKGDAAIGLGVSPLLGGGPCGEGPYRRERGSVRAAGGAQG